MARPLRLALIGAADRCSAWRCGAAAAAGGGRKAICARPGPLAAPVDRRPAARQRRRRDRRPPRRGRRHRASAGLRAAGPRSPAATARSRPASTRSSPACRPTRILALLESGKVVLHPVAGARGADRPRGLWRCSRPPTCCRATCRPPPPEGSLLPDTWLVPRGEPRARPGRAHARGHGGGARPGSGPRARPTCRCARPRRR